jgi:hypothetical protein
MSETKFIPGLTPEYVGLHFRTTGLVETKIFGQDSYLWKHETNPENKEFSFSLEVYTTNKFKVERLRATSQHYVNTNMDVFKDQMFKHLINLDIPGYNNIEAISWLDANYDKKALYQCDGSSLKIQIQAPSKAVRILTISMA